MSRLARYWYLPVIAVLAVVLIWLYTHPARPESARQPSRREQRATQQRISSRAAQVRTDTLQAKRLAQVAADAYQRGQRAAAAAARLHQSTTTYLSRHATPIPTTDSAALRLQRALAGYGH